MSVDLFGKVVAVTGASSGIGEAVAVACAEAGADVAICARRTERLDAVGDRIRSLGRRVFALTADIGDEQQAHAFVEGTAAELGRLDVLVNNAGLMKLGAIESAPTEEWREMVHVNVFGVLYCTRAALPLLRAQGGGHIVNVSSVGGRVVGHFSGVYSLTKFGIGAFSEALRREVKDAGIRVTLIEPGSVATELRSHTRQEVLDEILPAFAGVTPLEAEDVAAAVLYAIGQPPNVSVSELLVRPSAQQM
jgi:NADP-dependent 3-hydroxy acid dehydrogenase YdfG